MDMSDIFKQDQGDEGLRTVARMYAVYYNTMIAQGIPYELATQMVLDYHWLTTCGILFKDSQSYPARS